MCWVAALQKVSNTDEPVITAATAVSIIDPDVLVINVVSDILDYMVD